MKNVCMKLSLCLVLSFLPILTTSAATCDDLRQLYGGLPLDRQEYHDFIEYVDTLGEIQQKRENAAEMLNAQNRLNNLQNKYQDMIDERQEVVDELTNLISLDGDTLAIIGKARELVNLTDKVESVNLSNNSEIDVSSQTYNELNNQIGNNRNLINDNYNIGELVAEWPVLNYKEPKVVGMDTNGVYIDAQNAKAITALYTGIVTKVEYSETYGNWIEIQSGKGLKVTYSGLKNVLVKLGERVKAGSKLCNHCEDNTLYIEMILDDKYVNPMLVLGTDGIKANNDWIYNNVGESDMSKILSSTSYDYTPIERIYDTN